MKRILVLSLALILVVGSMAVPSYAAEFDNDMWTNVLEYSTANGSGGNSFTSDTTGYVTYTMPAGTAVNYIDALVKISGLVPSAVSISSASGNNPRDLSIINCGNGLYRIYGNTGNRVTGVLRLNFTFPESSGNYITFLSLKVGVGDRYYEPTMGMMSGNVAEGSIRLVYDPESSEIAGTSVVVDMNDDIQDYLLYLECSDWQKFDYIDYQVYITEVSSLDGITATFGDVSLPISLSYVDQVYDNAFYVSIRVDLTGIDRTASKDNYPMVIISGVCNYDFNYFALMSVTGIYKFDSVPWYLFIFQQWENVVSAWWDSLLEYQDHLLEQAQLEYDLIQDVTDNISSILQIELDEINSRISSWRSVWNTWIEALSTMLQTEFDEINSRISSWRSVWNTWTEALSTMLQTEFDEINSRISSWRSSWNTWISNLAADLEQIRTDLNTGFTNMLSSFSAWRVSWREWITSLGSKIDSILSALNSSGNEDQFGDDVGQQGDKLDDMEEVMGSVTKPALDRVDTNISGIVSDTDLANTAHVYTYIIDDNIMGPALTMVTILAMMSFALFGKR